MEKRGLLRITTVSWMAVLALVAVLGMGVWLPYGVAPAQAYRLPDTGQTKCYDNAQEIPCPQSAQAFYGQDGNYQGPQPAYRDNGDDTVTDLNTGLMWEQGDGQNDSGGRTWQQGGSYCAALDLGGHTDWRLPTKRELTSLVDVGIPYPGPTINTTYFPLCRSYYYWTGSTYARVPANRWYVRFDYGSAYAYDMSSTLYVRCARGGPGRLAKNDFSGDGKTDIAV